MKKKTREQFISDMCHTWRHDYGIVKDSPEEDSISSGMTESQRGSLWNQMAQLYDNCIGENDESHLPIEEQSLVFRLRKRAEIRRQIPGRKSVEEGKPDRIADLLEEAADYIEAMVKHEYNQKDT